MNIVVTGASGGIGYEVVKRLAVDKGNKIIAIARSLEGLNKLLDDCPNQNVFPISFDLSEISNYETLIKAISDHCSSVDVLLNNAGTILNKPFKNITPEDLESIYNINVFSPFQLIRKMLSLFNKNAHIVNISSMGGFQGSSKFAGLSAYSSSKAALSCITECLAEELKEDQISVNCLAIGAVQTKMLEKAFPGYVAPVHPVQMAEFISNFCINGRKYFNGKVLPVSLSTP